MIQALAGVILVLLSCNQVLANQDLDSLFDAPCERYGVPKALALAIASHESGMRPWAMNMPLLVCANRELGYMAAQGAVTELEHHINPSGAPFLPLMQLKVIYIINKIGLPYPPGMKFTLTTEKILF